ncbi:MAG: amidohydrolase family protein [Chloroflexota bacterium]
MTTFRVNHKIFDAHFHIGPWGTQSFDGHIITPMPGMGGIVEDHGVGADCAAYFERHGISCGLVVPTYLTNPTAAFGYNTLVLDAITEVETLFGGLWVSPMVDVQELNEKTLAMLPQPKIRALKIASNSWGAAGINPKEWTPQIRHNMESILDAAHRHQLPIQFHTGYLPGSDPLDFEAFMHEYGQAATYHLVHMGEAIAPAFRFVPRFIQWLKLGYDVYTDTSIVPGFGPSWLVHECQQAGIGLDRILFATDTPWGRFPSEYWKVAGIEVAEDVKELIFWRNAQALYNKV